MSWYLRWNLQIIRCNAFSPVILDIELAGYTSKYSHTVDGVHVEILMG